MELSIDTSTDWGGVALSEKGELLAEITWKPGRNHTVELYPNIAYLLESSNQAGQAISIIFVAIGPGSFNGLRAGISAAKGLAFSLGIPVKGVSTLEIEAYPFACIGLPICPIHDAGRGEIATAIYQNGDDWQCLRPEYLTTAEKLAREIAEPTVLCGEIPLPIIEDIKSIAEEKAIVPDYPTRLRRPAHLAYLGWKHFTKSGPDDIHTLQPVYLRQPPITQRKKKY